MTQLDLFAWANTRPTAKVIDLMPRLIAKIAREPYPIAPKNGDVIQIRKAIP